LLERRLVAAARLDEKVFTKLDIPSRRQLRRALPDGGGARPLPQRP
jgi:hypothetical protein